MGKMNRVTISVPNVTDLNFRKKAAIKFSFERGWYGRAVKEAMQLWINVQSITEESISDEKKDFIWAKFKDNLNIETQDPCEILDNITQYFTSEFKIAEEIDYEINDNEVIVMKKGSLEPLVSQFLTKKGDYVIFNCPVKIVMDAALKDLTGKTYAIKSEAHTMITTKAIKGSKAIKG
ncbi:hypothetical protein [Methanobacterium sp.]|uniref:hypothetical protein n=1 Tax=Methanobacterium sp. TaxID=2164 RepID=UPI002AB8C337|nr:hypothetical protein [Methanobacterium sp.]MDY9924294.1 hypothetical protein [Methanobacterium sp.]